MENFVDYCKDYIEETIDGYVGQTMYLCDFSWTLTEGPNADGSLTYSTYLAKQYLAEWWEEASEYYEYSKEMLGTIQNPFDDPEAYMVCMVIEGVRSLVDSAISELGMDDQWNDEVELTEELARKIVECVKSDNRISLF